MKKVILASTSPRRKELMSLLNVPFVIDAKEVDESFDACLSPAEVVQFLAEKKAKIIAETNPDAIVIGSDTVVVFKNEIIGKPTSTENAIEILEKLSGETHQVYTGVAILNGEVSEVFYEATDVKFFDLTQEEIEWYVATNEPLDKAGAYGIQGYGSTLVEKINGDYFTIVGLPVAKLKRKLKDFL
ncbi:MAG: septum formation inhibitor Maf [Bacillales bacterium]|jgi:septum formation protein|nr:septum formation inhibitor Maf [Bacillales bacterium]